MEPVILEWVRARVTHQAAQLPGERWTRRQRAGPSSLCHKQISVLRTSFLWQRLRPELLVVYCPLVLTPSLSAKPTGYKHSVPGPRGPEQPVRHLDLPLGLMTSKSTCQELFKAGNRSPGALNINKYLVDWFLPCFSKGNLLPGLSLQVVCSPETRIIQVPQLRVRGEKNRKITLFEFHCVLDFLVWSLHLQRRSKKLYCCVSLAKACCCQRQTCGFSPFEVY